MGIYINDKNMKKYLKYSMYAIILVISSLLLTGCTPTDEQLNKYSQLVSQADTFTQAHEYSSSIEKLNEATSIIPSKIDAYERIINIFVQKNRLDDAKDIVDKSANKLSTQDRSKLYFALGEGYYNIKDYDKALTSFELSNGISDIKEEAQFGLAKVYLQKGDVKNASNYLNNDFQGDLYYPSQILLSYIYSLTDTEKAKETIKELQPNEAQMDEYNQWSEILSSVDDDELFNATKLSRVYINSGYPFLAIATLEPIKDRLVEYSDGLYMLGKAYYEYGDYAKSISTLENATSLSDNSQYIYWIIARDYYLTNDINKSLEYYDTAITYGGDKTDEVLYQEYIKLLLDEGQTTKAEEVLGKASKIYEDAMWINLYHLKLVYEIDNTEKVTYYLSKIDQDKLEGNLKLDYLYTKTTIAIEEGKTDEALRTLDTIWNISQFDARYHLLMGQIKFAEGNLDEARNYLKKAIEYDMDRSVTDDSQKLLARID